MNPADEAARENARSKATGQFGTQDHSAPECSLATTDAPAATYTVLKDGAAVSGATGIATMTDALHQAHVIMNTTRYERDKAKPTFEIRTDEAGTTVTVPYGDQGRIVGYHLGDAVAAEELDARGLTLDDLESPRVEPFIDLGPYNEGDLNSVAQWARDAAYSVATVYATRDEETGERHVDVSVHENFLWNADTQFPDDEFEDDSDLDPDDDRPAAEQRYDAWLTANEDIVRAVYLERFNAEIDIPENWGYASVSLRTTVPYERFTDSLVIEDIAPLLAKHTNETDPGTFGSPYVMNEVWRRVEARDEERELAAERASQ